MTFARDRVRFNVGGRIFDTSATTLANAGRDSMLGALLDDQWNLPSPPQSSSSPAAVPEYFIDRNPACFEVLLDLLRTGELDIPSGIPERLLRREARFYGLLDHVRAARWGPFDGDRLRLSTSVSGNAPGDGTAVRAAPDGGCCVAHGSMVRVYDWVLEEKPPITLDYQHVNDVGYIDPDSIVVAARERLGKKDGGMGLFSCSGGGIRHRFQVSHGNQSKSFTAGALSFDDSGKIFASCKGRCNEHGVGVWDMTTGEQADFVYEPPDFPLGDADKLQWLDSGRCLMVATLFPKTDYCSIGLLDFREEKRVVWSWSDSGSVAASLIDKKRVLDVVAVEDESSVCVVNQYDDLGFLELRGGGGGGAVRWSSRSKLSKGRSMESEEPCYPKLAVHGGQLFSSMNDGIFVFSRAEKVLTTTLRSRDGASICDFSIGGGRLFALHGEENVFDVWETPPSSSTTMV